MFVDCRAVRLYAQFPLVKEDKGASNHACRSQSVEPPRSLPRCGIGPCVAHAIIPYVSGPARGRRLFLPLGSLTSQIEPNVPFPPLARGVSHHMLRAFLLTQLITVLNQIDQLLFPLAGLIVATTSISPDII